MTFFGVNAKLLKLEAEKLNCNFVIMFIVYYGEVKIKMHRTTTLSLVFHSSAWV